MRLKAVLAAAHKAAATGFYKPAVNFLMEDSGKSFTEALNAIGKAIDSGMLSGAPGHRVDLTPKGVTTLKR